MIDPQPGQLTEAERLERERNINEPARPDGSGAFRDHKDEDAPIAAWLREFFARPQVQQFMEGTRSSAERAGVNVEKVQEVAGSAKDTAQGWLAKLEEQAREKPLQTLALVFGAGFLLSRIGRGR
jgi:hypothetical protein